MQMFWSFLSSPFPKHQATCTQTAPDAIQYGGGGGGGGGGGAETADRATRGSFSADNTDWE